MISRRCTVSSRLGVLTSISDETPVASHLPLLERETSQKGTLIGHMAKANPQ
ncbi:MAG: FMN-binding negative transcriptional regulator [Fuerstiella sp.]|nr:FMN-binding negative transcriptional regulator [Fuerstiella sp.]MCP4506377.1 FMN-binding negative transcriptional regulator [Fuerstiella sp.]